MYHDNRMEELVVAMENIKMVLYETIFESRRSSSWFLLSDLLVANGGEPI